MDLTDVKTLKNVFLKHDFIPRKSWGQNFLVDKKILEKITSIASLSEKDTVIEIGAGAGTLTTELSKRAKKIIAIEKDKKLIPILQEVLKKRSNVKIVNKDILSYSPRFHLGRCKYKIVGNVPYYITSPIIRKFLEEDTPPAELVLTIQREVAERIIAKPPNMNLLAVSVQFYGVPEIVSFVSKNSFFPPPGVESAVMRIVLNYQRKNKKFRERFFKIVKTGFAHPRKQVGKNLSLLDKTADKDIRLSSQAVLDRMKELSINPQRRAETLSVEEWINLTNGS